MIEKNFKERRFQSMGGICSNLVNLYAYDEKEKGCYEYYDGIHVRCHDDYNDVNCNLCWEFNVGLEAAGDGASLRDFV